MLVVPWCPYTQHTCSKIRRCVRWQIRNKFNARLSICQRTFSFRFGGTGCDVSIFNVLQKFDAFIWRSHFVFASHSIFIFWIYLCSPFGSAPVDSRHFIVKYLRFHPVYFGLRILYWCEAARHTNTLNCCCCCWVSNEWFRAFYYASECIPANTRIQNLTHGSHCIIHFKLNESAWRSAPAINGSPFKWWLWWRMTMVLVQSRSRVFSRLDKIVTFLLLNGNNEPTTNKGVQNL